MRRPNKSSVVVLAVVFVVSSMFYVMSYASYPKGGDDGFVLAGRDELRLIDVLEPLEDEQGNVQVRAEGGAIWPHHLQKKRILVVLQSAPENSEIRDIFRTELYFSAPVRLLFLVDPREVIHARASSAHASSIWKQLESEKEVFHDILYFPPFSNSAEFSEEEKLRYVLANAPSDVNFMITATDDVLLFVDHIYEELQTIMDTTHEVFHHAYTQDGNSLWAEVCIADIRKQPLSMLSHGSSSSLGSGLKPLPVRCGFGGNTMPSSLYDWIGGRCQSSSVYYLRNNGPSGVMKKFARKVYQDHRKTHTFCREDREEIETHNKVWREMLKAWVDFADRYKLRWFLMSGPLIGAVRHQGFVPFDPDLDLMLLPESLEDAVNGLLKEEKDLPFFLARRDHQYLRYDEHSDSFKVNLPPSFHLIAPYFQPGCKEGCWDGGPLVGKLRHKHSCYAAPWSGGYVLDIFILPPQDMPQQLQTCTIEGMKVPCPADLDGWLTREVASNWLIPEDDPEKLEIIKKSNPFKACHELDGSGASENKSNDADNDIDF